MSTKARVQKKTKTRSGVVILEVPWWNVRMSFPPKSWYDLETWMMHTAFGSPDPEILLRDALREKLGELGTDALIDQVKRADRQFAEEVISCIDDLLVTGQPDWGSLSEGAKVILRARLEVALFFVHRMFVGSGKERGTPIPFPQDAVAICRWLLVDWWNQHGANELVTDLAAQASEKEDS